MPCSHLPGASASDWRAVGSVMSGSGCPCPSTYLGAQYSTGRREPQDGSVQSQLATILSPSTDAPPQVRRSRTSPILSRSARLRRAPAKVYFEAAKGGRPLAASRAPSMLERQPFDDHGGLTITKVAMPPERWRALPTKLVNLGCELGLSMRAPPAADRTPP
jgi:hypothetical protein